MEQSILEVVHESAENLYEAGAIDITTMREYDSLCLPEVEELTPKQIQRIREKTKVSQPVFAKFLNISSSTVKHWETGEKHPSAPCLKLLHIVKDKGLAVLA